MELFVYLGTFNVKSNQLMKNLFLLLILSASIISCKKDKLSTNIIGNWHKSDGSTLKITDNKYTYKTEASLNYTLNGDVLSLSNGACKKVSCDNNTLTVEVTSCNGLAGAVDGSEGTYTKD